MGVSVRSKPGTDKFYRHAGVRIAFKYDTEDEANDVAKEFRKQINLGLLDIAALRKKRNRRKGLPFLQLKTTTMIRFTRSILRVPSPSHTRQPRE